ncbi:MAG: hypothetical protein CVU39_09965 [Chloroflexi bacterium HGW-Chloroflexi-10]|nr:MAG: hypothetical protein CVU39_09965 [Chloroflexi bacterium HGW-Chloroflexi-10]
MPQKIHLIFKTHLDVGFTNYAAAVVQNYFTNYIPAAMRVARELRESGRPERFIWTTGSWLIWKFLEEAAPEPRKQMEEAIVAGDLAWHALPFTTHTELMDADLFRRGLSLSQQLDRRFGKRTIAAKLTDVPGHTRGIVPLLAEAGVQFLHLGVNGSSTLPQLPPLFRWQDISDSGAEIMVMLESGYGSTFTVAGIDDSLAFSHTSDNLGPQTSEQVVQAYQEAQNAHPDAQVFASTLDAFAAALAPVRASLPVVTQEIGDTWIHGVGSDPIKVSQLRELLRLRTTWLQENPRLSDDPQYQRFEQKLLMVAEHTWGMDEKTFLADHENYSKAAFNTARNRENFRTFEASWKEKRAYIQAAVDALGVSQMAHTAHERLAAIRPAQPDLSTWQSAEPGDLTLTSAHFSVQFDPRCAALVSLVSLPDQREWADQEHSLGRLRYQTFSAADYERFFRQYILPEEQHNDWSREDFTKPGLENSNALSRLWQPQVTAQYRRQSDADIQVLFHLRGEAESVENGSRVAAIPAAGFPASPVDYGETGKVYLPIGCGGEGWTPSARGWQPGKLRRQGGRIAHPAVGQPAGGSGGTQPVKL